MRELRDDGRRSRFGVVEIAAHEEVEGGFGGAGRFGHLGRWFAGGENGLCEVEGRWWVYCRSRHPEAKIAPVTKSVNS